MSASQVKTHRDCNRKWYFEKVVFLDEPPRNTGSTALGTEVHAAIEDFLTGKAGLEHVLLVDNQWLRALPSHDEMRVEQYFECADFSPVAKGYIDLVLIDRAAKHVLVVDHKTTKDWKYARTADELRQDPQALFYLWVLFKEFGIEYTYEFGHHVILTSKREKERFTSFVTSGIEILQGKKDLDRSIEGMAMDARAVDHTYVDGDYSACFKYGRCQFWSYCRENKEVKVVHDVEAPVVAVKPTVYVDCMPVGAQVTWFEDWINPITEAYFRDNGEHYLVTRYNEGAKKVGAEAATRAIPHNLVLRTSNPAAVVFENLVTGKANIVRGIR